MGNLCQEVVISLLAVGFEHKQDEPQEGHHREESNMPQQVWSRPSIAHAVSVRFSRYLRMRREGNG